MKKDNLQLFLEEKTLYYDKIDYDVIAHSWSILKSHIVLPYIIHIVGTNGKGSTGRFIASFLKQHGKDTIHYSSPHVVEFNERIWINGKNSTTQELNIAHVALQNILPNDLILKLTYFEYTTLICLYLSSKRDFIVLEAGLGGEFDATNVVKNDLSVITTIDLDHQEFLGKTIEEIATTKMKSCDTAFIVAKQINPEVYGVKDTILSDKKEIVLQSYTLSKEGKNLPNYLQRNLEVALSVLEYLEIDVQKYTLPKLFARFQKITPNITIDVGHNPLAAKVICEQLLQENKKVILIYNSYKDKDYTQVLTILKPVIQEVQIISCDDSRIVEKFILENTIENLGLNINTFDTMKLNTKNNYLVFGSFLVVEEFLKGYAIYEKR